MSVAPHIVSLYAALLAFAFVGLSIRTLRLRKRLRIVIGDAGDTSMLRAMRVHANFAEYVPLALVLILLIEAAGGAAWLVHVLGSPCCSDAPRTPGASARCARTIASACSAWR